MNPPAAANATAPWVRTRYRVRQFVRGLKARVSAAELVEARRLLPGSAIDLFVSLPVDAQRHSLDVLADLRAGASTNPDLAAAALLHDCGKLAESRSGIHISLWMRGPLVLLSAAAPAVARRWSRPEPDAGWRYVLFVHDEHPALGAEMAKVAGCSEETCWLIAHHQDAHATGGAEQMVMLQRLQWADNRN